MKIVEEHYYCDYCSKEIGDKKHISITIDTYAGVVQPPKWKHPAELEYRPFQFCNLKCLGPFLTKNKKKK